MARLRPVEDATATALGSVLEPHGHQVTLADSSFSALRAVNEPTDLVLLDLGPPDLGGVEVCRRLRTALTDVVIVVLAGPAGEMDVVVGREVGTDAYVVEPVGAKELLARLRAHLRRIEPRTAPWTTRSIGTSTIDVRTRQVCVGG